MRTSKRMAAIITQIAEAVDLDLTKPGEAARIENAPYMSLHIECIGENLVSVAHYYRQNGDSVADPDQVFFTKHGVDAGWIPVSIQQPGGYVMGYGGFGGEFVATIIEDSEVKSFYPDRQASQASFANTWATNLRAQGFLTEARRTARTLAAVQ